MATCRMRVPTGLCGAASRAACGGRTVGGEEVPVRACLGAGFEELVDDGEVRLDERRVVEVKRVQRQAGAGGAAGEPARPAVDHAAAERLAGAARTLRQGGTR